MKKIKFKRRVSDTRLFQLAMMTIVIVFTLSLFDLVQNKNINFDSRELVVDGGYKSVYDGAVKKGYEIDQYINTNNEQISSYGIDFDNTIYEIEAGNIEQQITKLNELEKDVNDKSLYISDVSTILYNEHLKLNIEAYDMVENDETSGRSDLYNKIENIELAYDAFTNNIKVEDVNLTATTSSALINNDLNSWSRILKKRVINILLLIYSLIAFGVIIYRSLKDRKTTVLLVFTYAILASVFGFRMVEERYDPAYVRVNTMLGVNQNTEGNYFINFMPIVLIDSFVSNGGDFNTMIVDGESMEVDWSKSKDIESWLNSPYIGDESVSNGTRLRNIDDSMKRPLWKDENYIGYYGVGGWDV